eukprot:Polyplicarium_translucidae@DN1317_c0_g1_i1.p1
MKQGLLLLLDKETSASVRNSICILISDMARLLLPENAWAELVVKIVEWVQSSDPRHQSSGLQIMEEIAPHVSNIIPAAHVDAVVAKLMTSTAEVRTKAISFVIAVVSCEPRSRWKVYEPLVPGILELLNELISEDDGSEAFPTMVKIVEVVEVEPNFFRAHAHAFVQAMLSFSRKPSAVRELTMEALLLFVEKKPKSFMKIPQAPSELIRTLMEFMLTVEDDADWADRDNSDDDDDQMVYDVGEGGLDRVAAAIGGDDIMPIVFRFVHEFLQQPGWKHKFVAIMTVSQTAEYIPEDNRDATLEGIVEMLVARLEDENSRVRFAVCQALGQISLDHQPEFQRAFTEDVLPALLKAMSDPVARVRSHAIAAMINFAEEVACCELLPFSDGLMERLCSGINFESSKGVREQCITGIAVVAGVLGSHFVKFYQTVVPPMKLLAEKCTTQLERNCRGKVLECLSIIGLSVGKECFANDAHDVTKIIIQILSSHMDADDPVKEYGHEALRRLCRTMVESFVPYLDHVMPVIFRGLDVKPVDLLDREVPNDAEDMSFDTTPDGGLRSLRTSIIEDVQRAVQLIASFVEILGDHFGKWIAPTVTALMPLLGFTFSDTVRRAVLVTLAYVIKAARHFGTAQGLSDVPDVANWIGIIGDKVFRSIDEEFKSDNPSTPSASAQAPEETVSLHDVENVAFEAAGLAKCLRSAGARVLNGEQVAQLCLRSFSLLQDSTARRSLIAAKRNDPDNDEEDIEIINAEIQEEQTFRSAILEIVGAVMLNHPELFLQFGAEITMKFVRSYSAPQCSEEDRALALYVCDDIIECLKDNGAPLWPEFLPYMIDSIRSTNPDVRQAAAYGIIEAALCTSFSSAQVQAAGENLVSVLRQPLARKKAMLSATDNCVAALGSLAFNKLADLGDAAGAYIQLWLENLPLKTDAEEGRKVHGVLLSQIKARNPFLLGPDNANARRLASVMIEIYQTETSSDETDEDIRAVVSQFPPSFLESLSTLLPKSQRKSLQRVLKDIQTKPSSPQART